MTTAVYRWMLVALALCLAVQAWAGQLVVDFMDVGQGDGILIRTADKAVLIDAGVKKARVTDQLDQLGVARLDLVVGTHPHADHIGGMERVLRRLDVGLYMDNGLLHTTQTYESLMLAVEERRIPYRTAHTGMELNLGDEAKLVVLFPDETPLRDTRSDLNSNSVVLLLEHGDVRMLFTGDAEEPTEQALVRRNLPDLDVLKVAHHGSSHSNTTAFLDAVDPDFAVISCGDDNRYGHPDVEALVRLARAGATIFRTDMSGHVRAISDGASVEFLEGPLSELGPGPFAPVPRVATAPTTTITEPAASDRSSSAAGSGLDLSGVQAPNEAFDDLSPRPNRKKKRKNRDSGG